LKQLNFQAAVLQAVKDSSETIADLQAMQLSKGQTKQGGELPYYSKSSIENFGKQPGPWKLFDTGSLYRALKVVEINPSGWTITTESETAKLIFPKLAKKGYKRTDVLGLNPETRKGGATNEPLAPTIRRNLFKDMRKQTGIKF
jgi:hypothetical protein